MEVGLSCKMVPAWHPEDPHLLPSIKTSLGQGLVFDLDLLPVYNTMLLQIRYNTTYRSESASGTSPASRHTAQRGLQQQWFLAVYVMQPALHTQSSRQPLARTCGTRNNPPLGSNNISAWCPCTLFPSAYLFSRGGRRKQPNKASCTISAVYLRTL